MRDAGRRRGKSKNCVGTAPQCNLPGATTDLRHGSGVRTYCHIAGNIIYLHDMRLVLDTDVMVAALRSRRGASRAWLLTVLRGQVEIALSVPLVLQYEEVLTRPEHLAQIGGTTRQIGRILDAVCAVCHPIEISFLWRPTLRDPSDEMMLETAVNGRADWLLTFNDKDFVGAERFGVKVGRPGPVWRLWKGV